MVNAMTALLEKNHNIIKGKGETILLADHAVFVLDTFRNILEELNYRVLTASDGQMALDVYQSHRDEIDLLVMDFVLPGLGGREILQAIRNLDPAVRVIFITGYEKMHATDNKEDDSNRETVLHKPFRVAELSQAVARALAD